MDLNVINMMCFYFYLYYNSCDCVGFFSLLAMMHNILPVINPENMCTSGSVYACNMAYVCCEKHEKLGIMF